MCQVIARNDEHACREGKGGCELRVAIGAESEKKENAHPGCRSGWPAHSANRPECLSTCCCPLSTFPHHPHPPSPCSTTRRESLSSSNALFGYFYLPLGSRPVSACQLFHITQSTASHLHSSTHTPDSPPSTVLSTFSLLSIVVISNTTKGTQVTSANWNCELPSLHPSIPLPSLLVCLCRLQLPRRFSNNSLESSLRNCPCHSRRSSPQPPLPLPTSCPPLPRPCPPTSNASISL